MKLTEKSRPYEHSYFIGRMKKFRVIVDRDLNRKEKPWYFYANRKDDDKVYNSLWDNVSYISLDACKEAAETWINENA